ncbi:MAG TPA: hypothetical protein VK633_03485, partial [Verrucomicrobiae bacterium]|nr:hypothetical protein [Verrucomicrobiae bacterium]
MISDKSANVLAAPADERSGRSSFFRQSGWMLVATTLSGVLMYAVHKVAKEMPKSEYGVFMTLLQVLNMMTIPAMGLQLVFVQQTVAALSQGERRQLTGTVRGVVGIAFGIWLCIALAAFIFQNRLAAAYKIENPAAIWATVAMALIAVVNPVVMGLLQGKMNFLWLGIAAMLNGAGRLIAIGVIVLVLGGYAAGAMSGAVIGMGLAVGVAAWHTRDIWAGPSEPIQWRPWLTRVIPLTLGFGTATVMLSWDMIVV